MGGCYNLHLLCWHASITLACKMVIFFKASVLIIKNLRNIRGARIIQGGGRMTPSPPPYIQLCLFVFIKTFLLLMSKIMITEPKVILD